VIWKGYGRKRRESGIKKRDKRENEYTKVETEVLE